MTTLQSGTSIGTRIKTGESVIHAAKRANTAPITKRLTAFVTIHRAYVKADRVVKKATDALGAQQKLVAEADTRQDDAVVALAVALPADGLPRINPFKPFGAPSPAKVCALGQADEAKQVLALEKAVLKRKGISAPTIKAAKAAGKAARLVQQRLVPLAELRKAQTDAMSEREAVGQDWETAFAALKNAARAADDDGAKGLFAKLFRRPAAPKKARPKRAKDGATEKPDASAAAGEQAPANETEAPAEGEQKTG